MRSPLLLPLTIILAFSACKTDKDRLAEFVEEWQGKEIVFPEVMTDFLSGDTIDLSDADFTIFTYVDSVGCSGCKMKLSLWKEFLNSLDSIAYSDVNFIMVVNGANKQNLSNLVKIYSFEYPIYVDEMHRITKKYSLSESSTLQTFLLDKDMKVMAIGNPIYSSDIKRMYKDIISGKMAFSSAGDTLVTIEPNKINLGNLYPYEVANHTVVISNMGDDTIRIRKIVSSCECTNLEIQNGILPPKSQVEATLTFSGDTLPGKFERIIHVYYEDFESPTVLYIFGSIVY